MGRSEANSLGDASELRLSQVSLEACSVTCMSQTVCLTTPHLPHFSLWQIWRQDGAFEYILTVYLFLQYKNKNLMSEKWENNKTGSLYLIGIEIEYFEWFK